MLTAYLSQSPNTSVAADQLRFTLLRGRSPANRLEMAAALNRSARELSLHSLRQRFSHLSPTDFARQVAQVWLGHHGEDEHPYAGFEPKGDVMSWIQDSLALALQLHPIFERAGIGHYITNGVAATAYGEPRTTQDLDVVINLSVNTLVSLVQTLEQEGFDVPGLEDVVNGRSRTLPIILHQETIMQADLMLSGTREFDALTFERRQLLSIPNRGDLYFVSPEDLILNKLKWRQGSRSEKQWRDILGILKTQTDRLNQPYLREWATRLQVLSDLEQALREAGL